MNIITGVTSLQPDKFQNERGKRMDNFSETTVSKKLIFEGKIIKLEKLEVKLPNGKISEREIVRHPGGAVVLPVDDEGNIYLVRQYRKPLEEHLYELPAGKLDNGEDPLQCAIRELKEETGLISQEIKLITKIATTPGFSDEILYLYLAKGLKKETSRLDEDEFLSVCKFSIDELMAMIKRGEIIDSKTIIGILYANIYINI